MRSRYSLMTRMADEAEQSPRSARRTSHSAAETRGAGSAAGVGRVAGRRMVRSVVGG